MQTLKQEQRYTLYVWLSLYSIGRDTLMDLVAVCFTRTSSIGYTCFHDVVHYSSAEIVPNP